MGGLFGETLIATTRELESHNRDDNNDNNSTGATEKSNTTMFGKRGAQWRMQLPFFKCVYD